MEAKTRSFRKRNAILSCLRQSQLHPSAEMLFQSLKQESPEISMATVYRNLSYFVAQGTVVSLGMIDGAERFDAVLQPHSHLACRCCGKVMDWGTLPGLPAPPPGWKLEELRLVYLGVCPSCQDRKESFIF